MNRTSLILVTCALFTTPVLIGAAPTPGCSDFSSAGTWSEMQAAYGDSWSELHLSDGLTFGFQDSSVFLTNAPGTFWFSPGDTNISFEYLLSSLTLDIRRPGDPSTNGGYMEVEVSAHGGPFAFLATFAGVPEVTNVPEDPTNGTPQYTITTAPLSWARICISSNLNNSTVPLTIRARLSETPQVELSWAASTNGLYQLQWSPGLVEGSWTDLGVSKAGNGTNLRAIDPLEPSIPQRFYRVLQFP